MEGAHVWPPMSAVTKETHGGSTILQCKMVFIFSEKNSLYTGARVPKSIGFVRHRVSKCARHNGVRKLLTDALKIIVTRCPCGSSDKTQLYHNTKLSRVCTSRTQRSSKSAVLQVTGSLAFTQSSTLGQGGVGRSCGCSRHLKKVLL